jgi:hypothetical protein
MAFYINLMKMAQAICRIRLEANWKVPPLEIEGKMGAFFFSIVAMFLAFFDRVINHTRKQEEWVPSIEYFLAILLA